MAPRPSYSRRLPVVSAIAALLTMATFGLGGCAGGISHGWSSTRQLSEGRLVALRSCGGCHAFDMTGKSHDPLAPPFRTLVARFPGEALNQRLDVVTEHGHVNMPPIYISPQERRALLAYLRSIAVREADGTTKS